MRTGMGKGRNWGMWLVLGALLGMALVGPSIARSAPGGGAAPCVNGMAGSFPCQGVDLLSFMPLSELGGASNTGGANVWGWTDGLTGKRYVLMGLTDATAFVDASDPQAPVYLGSLATHTTSSTYRDIKVYADHAFIVADSPSEHGMQVFDLTTLRDVVAPPVAFTESTHFGGFGNGHNLFINEASGFAYVARTTGPELCDGALTMINVQQPMAPALAGCFAEDGLASDSMCVLYHGPDLAYQGREICVVASDDAIVVGDMTDKAAPLSLARLTYPHVTRAHHVWLTDNHEYFLSSDMNDEHHMGLNTRIFVWRMTDVDAPALIGTWEAPYTASDHNVWVKGNHAYVGNFHAGVRILDLTQIATGQLTEAGYFDMVPEDDDASHVGGAWALYPYFDDGLLAVSDKEAGLYLLRESNQPTALTVGTLQAGRTLRGIAPLALVAGVLAAVALMRHRVGDHAA